LYVDDELGFFKLGLQARVLSTQAGELVGLRVAGRNRTTSQRLRVIGQGAAVALLAPLGHMGAVEAVTPEQLAAAGIATRIGFVLSQDGQALGWAEGALHGLYLSRGALRLGSLRLGTRGGHSSVFLPPSGSQRVSGSDLSKGRLAHRDQCPTFRKAQEGNFFFRKFTWVVSRPISA
jgi:hypothetical protein